MKDVFFVKILPLIIYFSALYIVPTFFAGRTKAENVPRSVKMGSWGELIFGLMIFFSGAIYLVFLDPEKISNPAIPMLAFAGSAFIGMLWLIMAVRLNHGSRQARTVCLVLSFIRIPTMIGILFSIVDLYLLYFTKQSRLFFNRPLPSEAA